MDSFSFENPALPVSMRISRFRGPGGVDEYHLVIRPRKSGSFNTQLDWLSRAYGRALDSIGLDTNTVLLRRFFCSDLPNQAAALEARPFSNPRHTDKPCAVSWVCQPPGPSANISLWAYHVSDPNGPLDKFQEGNSLIFRRGRLAHHWTTGMTCLTADTSHGQTRGIFKEYNTFLRSRGMSLKDHAIRTWFFVQNIDTNYPGFVAARKEFFAAHGLTENTHFIASTAVEGSYADVAAKVTMEAYAISGLGPEQISFLAAPDHLSPTHIYGVTFERGTSVAYRDRTHVIISGTASIDSKGSILYPDDALRQLDRTIENIEALLERAGATMKDMGVIILYIRDPGDYAIIWQNMRKRLGDIPMVAVCSRICRPGWLVEVEGIAVIPASKPELPVF